MLIRVVQYRQVTDGMENLLGGQTKKKEKKTVESGVEIP